MAIRHRRPVRASEGARLLRIKGSARSGIRSSHTQAQEVHSAVFTGGAPEYQAGITETRGVCRAGMTSVSASYQPESALRGLVTVTTLLSCVAKRAVPGNRHVTAGVYWLFLSRS